MASSTFSVIYLLFNFSNFCRLILSTILPPFSQLKINVLSGIRFYYFSISGRNGYFSIVKYNLASNDDLFRFTIGFPSWINQRALSFHSPPDFFFLPARFVTKNKKDRVRKYQYYFLTLSFCLKDSS